MTNLTSTLIAGYQEGELEEQDEADSVQTGGSLGERIENVLLSLLPLSLSLLFL